MNTQRDRHRGAYLSAAAGSYSAPYLDLSYSVDTDQLSQEPIVTRDGARFTIFIDEIPFEFAITRQALEDIEGARCAQPDLAQIFFRHRESIEAIARELVDAGVRWPNLVIRMQDVGVGQRS